jgi:hypothetical protein
MNARPLLLLLLLAAPLTAQAGGWHQPRVTIGSPSGTQVRGVPLWAARRLATVDGPIYVNPNSRRPWLSAVTRMNTPSQRMANYYQNGGGVGTYPDSNNGPTYFTPYSTFNYPIP